MAALAAHTTRPVSFYIELRNGKIWRYRDYWDAWTLQDAWGDREDLNANWGQPDPETRDRPYLTE